MGSTNKRFNKLKNALQNLHLLPSRLYCRLWNHTKSCHKGSRAQEIYSNTADREFHPAPKIDRINFYKFIILDIFALVKKIDLKY